MDTRVVRQRAQELIAAYIHNASDLGSLMDEAARECPDEMLHCLAAFIAKHTVDVDPAHADVRGNLSYTAHAAVKALDAIARGQGIDTHELTRSYLMASSKDHDEHLDAAQALLAASASPALDPVYQAILNRCAPAWGPVTDALIDIWLTAALDALPACRAQALFAPMLASAQHVIQALATFSECTLEVMLQGYWIALAQADAYA